MFITSQHEIDVAVIGGVGFNPDPGLITKDVKTPYGTVTAKIGNVSCHGRTIGLAVIQRHNNKGKHLPPHRLNYRAIVWAVKAMGARRVIATNSVGAMGSQRPGSFFVPYDFIDQTRSRPGTFFDDRTVHVDMTTPYCPEIKNVLLQTLDRHNLESNTGIYVCTEGPRFETASEIRMLTPFGDVVGMTGVPEVVLAKELGLCYATLCIITNKACGLAKKLTADEVLEMLDVKQDLIRKVLLDAITSLPAIKDCDCQYATSGARVP